MTARQIRKTWWLFGLAAFFIAVGLLIRCGFYPHPGAALFGVVGVALCLVGDGGEGRERPWGDAFGPDIYGNECNCSILAWLCLLLIVGAFLVGSTG